MKAIDVVLKDWQVVLVLVTILGLGFLFGFILCGETASACEPCLQPPPDCGYIQVVNPITGELEQEYVCQ